MLLNFGDWLFIAGFFLLSLVIGLAVMKRAGSGTEEFFAGGRKMPWWLLGVSMVATTFSTDTPNLVTDIVRTRGVSGNWAWFAFLITGMVTVFIYAKLWKRSNVLTDVEFYELRYSGKTAAFLRGFRAIYLGVFFNVIVMAMVTLAAIKIGSVLLGISPFVTVSAAGAVVVIYSIMGGLRGVLITDFFQFIIAMFGAIAVAVTAVNLPQVGGLSQLLANETITSKLSIMPDLSNKNMLMSVFIIPIAVQWWAAWYPGSEPGGGGYVAQRMFAAKDEKNAMGATLLFNITHYALRPWPWIIVALASLIVFPDLEALKNAFPNVPADKIGHDLAYPAMISFLPHGLLGLVVASLIAAYMSTISTHLNWGSSYIVNDFYKRFIKKNNFSNPPQPNQPISPPPNGSASSTHNTSPKAAQYGGQGGASPLPAGRPPGGPPEANNQPSTAASEKELVLVGRLSTLGLMILAGIFALALQNAFQVFKILLQIGAGTGLLFLLRWFWWRINAVSEITAMVVSFLVALYFEFGHGKTGLPVLEDWQQFSIGVAVTTLAWLAATFATKPTDKGTLLAFYKQVRPGGRGWKRFLDTVDNGETRDTYKSDLNLPSSLACVFWGCLTVYAALFSIGYWIYGDYPLALITTFTSLVSSFFLAKGWGKQSQSFN